MTADSAPRWGTVRVDPDTRNLLLASADGAVSVVSLPALEADGNALRLGDAASWDGAIDLSCGEEGEVRARFETPRIDWRIQASLSEDGETVLLSSEVGNWGETAVALGKCCLVDGSASIEGDDGRMVYLEVRGTQGHTVVRRAADVEGACWSRTYLQLVSHAAGRALHLGFVTYHRTTTLHEFTYSPGTGIQALRSISDFEGHELPPGQSIHSDTLVVEARTDFHASLHNWADRVAAYYKPSIWPKIPGGWLGWSWVDAFNAERYEDVVIRNVNAIRRRLPGCDIEYVWVSIGNIQDGLPGNWLQWDQRSFPHGPQWLVRQLGDLGFTLGLWCGAFWMCEGARPFDELSEAFLRLDGAWAVAQPAWPYGVSARKKPEDRPKIYSLDPTHPKAAEFLREVFETYRDWGVRYYMIDFLNAIAGPATDGANYDDWRDKSVLKGADLFRTGLEIIREAAGPDAYLLASSGPTLQTVGLLDAARVGNDYGEGRAINPESYFFPATFVTNSAEFWTSHRHASDNMAASYYTHRKLYVNDSCNVMTVDKPIPLCEAQITATLFGLCGGPVMLGDDIDRISEDRLALIRKVFPRTPECAASVDLFDCPAPDYPKLFHQRVVTDWGEWDLLGVINYGREPLQMAVPFERLGLDPGAPQRLWEFWDEQYLGEMTGELPVCVPPTCARLYRLSRALDHPWVLSTDMHALQGRVELQDVAWDPATGVLSGKAARPAGESGNLFIFCPKSMRVKKPRRLWLAKDAREGGLLVRVQFSFGDKPQPFAVRFCAIDEPVTPDEWELE